MNEQVVVFVVPAIVEALPRCSAFGCLFGVALFASLAFVVTLRAGVRGERVRVMVSESGRRRRVRRGEVNQKSETRKYTRWM